MDVQKLSKNVVAAKEGYQNGAEKGLPQISPLRMFAWFLFFPFMLVRWLIKHPSIGIVVLGLFLLVFFKEAGRGTLGIVLFVACMGWLVLRIKRSRSPEALAHKVADESLQQIWSILEPVYGDRSEYAEKHARQLVTLHPDDRTGNVVLSCVVPPGSKSEDIINRIPYLQDGLHIPAVQPVTLPNQPRGVVNLLLVYRDRLTETLQNSEAGIVNMTWDAARDPYEWISVGVDSVGNPIDMPLFLKESGSCRYLVGGVSGSGKSSIPKQLFFHALRSAETTAFDGKGGSELGEFRDYVDHDFIAQSGEDTKSFMRHFSKLVSDRGALLNQNKKAAALADVERFSESWNTVDDGPMHVIFWDEPSRALSLLSSTDARTFQTDFYAAASVCRSLGIALIVSGQSFRADTFETKTRDNCFDAIIGYQQGSATEASYIGFSPDDVLNPANIEGQMTRDGIQTSVGQFMTKGIKRTHGKAFFFSSSEYRRMATEWFGE